MASSEPTRVVVPDASVAAKWYFGDEEHTKQARTILDGFRRATVELLVPDSFFYELVALLRKPERRQPPRLTPTQIDVILADIVVLPIPGVESRSYLREAMDHSRTLNVSIYDALYLAVAERAGATYVTADRQLYDRIQHLPYVRLLNDL